MWKKPIQKKRKTGVADDEDIAIPAPDGWPTTEFLMEVTPTTIIGKMPFSLAAPILARHEACPMIVNDNYIIDEDGKPTPELGDGKLAGAYVYHPCAAPHCYEQPAIAAVTIYLKQHHMHGINPYPAWMIFDRDNPTIDASNGSKMHNLTFRRLDPANEVDRRAFNLIPDHVKRRHKLELTPATVQVHEGEAPKKIII